MKLTVRRKDLHWVAQLVLMWAILRGVDSATQWVFHLAPLLGSSLVIRTVHLMERSLAFARLRELRLEVLMVFVTRLAPQWVSLILVDMWELYLATM